MFQTFYQSGYLAPATVIVSLVVALIHLLVTIDRPGKERSFLGFALVVILVLLMGLRPVLGQFVDMGTYAEAFRRAQFEYKVAALGDPLFDLFINFSAKVMDASTWFFLCALIYVVPKAWATKIWFGPRWPIAMAAMATSFSFYAFGVNGIRNGLATSFVLLAIAWPRKPGKLAFGIAGLLTHLSTAITLFAYALGSHFRSLNLWLGVWVASIPASLVAPSGLSTYFASSDFDGRSNYFAAEGAQGFRLDFLLYSALGVAAIVYWKVVRKFADDEYDNLSNTYLIANAFWILINQVSFSNRFAYLSWFLLEIVTLFPLLRGRLTRGALLPVLAVTLVNAAIFFVVVE